MATRKKKPAPQKKEAVNQPQTDKQDNPDETPKRPTDQEVYDRQQRELAVQRDEHNKRAATRFDALIEP